MGVSGNAKQERCYYIDWLRVLGMLVNRERELFSE